MNLPPPMPPAELLPAYVDQVEACRHTGPHAGKPYPCQSCGVNLICGHCTYESWHRYVCVTCYYRIDAWAFLARKQGKPFEVWIPR